MKAEACVKDVRLDEGYMYVVVKDSALFKKRLPTLASQADASLEEVKVAGRDLESLFRMAVS